MSGRFIYVQMAVGDGYMTSREPHGDRAANIRSARHTKGEVGQEVNGLLALLKCLLHAIIINHWSLPAPAAATTPDTAAFTLSRI